MTHLIQLLGYVCALVAALILGSWFLKDLRKSRSTAEPWYKVYMRPPGLLIVLIILLLPLIARFCFQG